MFPTLRKHYNRGSYDAYFFVFIIIDQKKQKNIVKHFIQQFC